MAPQNAILMGNNSRFPNVVQPGEQGNERRNAHYKAHKSKRGKEGLARGFARLDKAEIAWNNQQLDYYIRHPDKLEECQFSESLMEYMQDIQLRSREIGDMTDIIREKGIYEFEIPKDKINKAALQRAVQDSLELAQRSRKGNNTFFAAIGYRIAQYCGENARQTCFMSIEKDMPRIKNLMYDKLEDKVIMKIAASWGYYFK